MRGSACTVSAVAAWMFRTITSHFLADRLVDPELGSE